MSQISLIKVGDQSYFSPPIEGQYFKELAVLKKPNPTEKNKNPDWYIYYSIWDFTKGEWVPQKFYSKFTKQEFLIQKSKQKDLHASIELDEANNDLKNNINPRTGKPIAPFDKRSYAEALEDAKDESPIPRLEEAISIFLKVKSGQVGDKAGAENKENTTITYTSFFNRFLVWCKNEKIDGLRLDKFQRHQVHSFLESFYLNGTWVSVTYNNNLGFIKSFFNHFAKIYDYKNVVENLEDKEITEESDRFNPFTEPQLKEIFKFIDNSHTIVYPHYNRILPPDNHLGLICRTIFYTFLRPSEIARIKIKHIKRYKEGFFDLAIDITKNKKAVFNELYIEPCLVELYSKLGWERYFNDKKYENYYVFTSDLVPSLKKVTKDAFSRKFSTLINKLSYNSELVGKEVVKTLKPEWDDNFSLYSLKHTGNIIAFKAGFTLTQLQLQNRHSSVQQTENYLRKLKQEINEEPRPLRPAF